MATIILEGNSDSTVDKIVALAKELGLKLRVLSKSEEADFKLGQYMLESKTDTLVAEEDILKLLKK
jgi:ABC-type uncharacterized transport system substrate-binding protein